MEVSEPISSGRDKVGGIHLSRRNSSGAFLVCKPATIGSPVPNYWDRGRPARSSVGLVDLVRKRSRLGMEGGRGARYPSAPWYLKCGPALHPSGLGISVLLLLCLTVVVPGQQRHLLAPADLLRVANLGDPQIAPNGEWVV